MTDQTVDAPYGYKPDGTPRKRPPLSPEAQARAAATRRRNANGTNGTAPATTETDWVAQLETLATQLETAAARVRDALDAIR